MIRTTLLAAFVLLLSSPLAVPGEKGLMPGRRPVPTAMLEGVRGSCVEGLTMGHLVLPEGDEPGMARGVLVTDDGRVVLGLLARLEERRTDGELTAGRLSGILRTMGPRPHVVAGLSGRWVASAEGAGEFEARIVKRGDGVLSLGRLRGRFLDLPDDDRPGRYRGRWIVCRR